MIYRVLFAACVVSGAPIYLPPQVVVAGDEAITVTPDHAHTNSVGMKMVQIAHGTFQMGTKDAPGNVREVDEGPVEVTITAPFLIATTEVTQKQWQDVMSSRPWEGKLEGFKVGDDLPAAFITYSQALDFCDELTTMEKEAGTLPKGAYYMLPTEAQWEYACRAGRKAIYGFKGDHTALSDYAWWKVPDGGVKHAQPVGRKKANAWGLFDVHGNVREWCLDEYVKELPGGSDPQGKSKEQPLMQVTRGGSWQAWHSDCRCAARQGVTDYAREDTGLRVVCVGLPTSPPESEAAE